MNKKLLFTLLPAVIITGAAVGGATLYNPAHSDATDSPIVTQIDQQQKQLDNHEARISNTEADVSDLQTATNTTPSTNKVTVPAAQSTPVVSQPSLQAQAVSAADHGSITNTERCKTLTNNTPYIYTITHYADGSSLVTSNVGVDAAAKVCDGNIAPTN